MARADTTTLSFATIRHSQCELLLSVDESADHCHQCTRYRSTLRAIESRKRKQDITHRTELSSHVNLRYLSSAEKDERIKKQRHELRKMKLQVMRKSLNVKVLK